MRRRIRSPWPYEVRRNEDIRVWLEYENDGLTACACGEYRYRRKTGDCIRCGKHRPVTFVKSGDGKYRVKVTQ
jgi:hypothetical protein